MASAGHQLGQVVGNWFEEYVALPVLEGVADHLGLFCDTRFKARTCRGDKLIWQDADGNEVDYDFVFELGGTETHRGIPVAFFETFWRRGSRHSKDKARDDSGKLLGMRDSFPTARLLGIVAAGDFTGPAQQLLHSRDIDLFYISKNKIVSAWAANGITIDYDDKSEEPIKEAIARSAKDAVDAQPGLYVDIAASLFGLVGAAERKAFEDRVAGRIGATPQHYVVYVVDRSSHQFETRGSIDGFLSSPEPPPGLAGASRSYAYEVTFGDGDAFRRDDLDWEELRDLHASLDQLVDHMEELAGA